MLHATEGVWGLACDPFDAQAVARLLALKRRPLAKGLIVIGASESCFTPELEALESSAERKMVVDAWPGAVTWILPNVRFPGWITGGRDAVAVRVPGHPQARALAEAFGGPLVSTSANRSGEPAPTSGLKARRQFPAEEFDRKRSERLTGLMQWRDEPRILSSVAINRALYGDLHTYGVPVTGDERSLKGITTADLRAFHGSWYRPNNATLIVAPLDTAAVA